jgi:hypothetical protein
LSAAGLPAFGCRTTVTSGSPRPSTMSAVPSVDPSSTTTTSTGWRLATIERTAASMPALSL